MQNIEEVKLSFSAKFNLVAEWFDSRLTWNDLNDDDFLNIPDQDVIDKLWVPIIKFENTENKYETPHDQKATILVKKRGNPILSPIQEMEEIAYYKGSENSLQYARDFFFRFRCDFELRNFPFDTQICTFLLKKKSRFKKFMDLIPSQLQYLGPVSIAEFFIIQTDMVSGETNDKFDIKVRIIMKRRVSQHLLSTYLPSLCILIVAQV